MQINNYKGVLDIGNNYQILVEEVDDTTTYIGISKPGVTKDISKWNIKKIVTNGGITSISYPDGNNSFSSIWNDRVNYDYTIG